MDSRRLNILFGVIIAILVIVIGFLLVQGKDGDERYEPVATPAPTTNMPIVTKTAEPTSTHEPADETADWKTYENKTLGFSFKYPSEYGTFNLIVSNSETGKSFRGGFPKFSETWASNKFFSLGGITQDFSQGRSGYFLDFVRYAKESGKYYHLMAQNKKYEFSPIKVMTVDGQEVLIVDGNSYPSDMASEMGFGPGDNGGALINLPGNGEFTGLAIWNADSKKVSQAEFEKIISTFTFTR